MAYLTLSIGEVDSDLVYIGDALRNVVNPPGIFQHIYYSNTMLTLTGLYVHIPCTLSIPAMPKNARSCKINCVSSTLRLVKQFESGVLSKANCRRPKFSLHDTLANGTLRGQSPSSSREVTGLVAKISGIWSKDAESGLTFKLMPAS